MTTRNNVDFWNLKTNY